jgi:hypothetical protein
MIVIPQYLINLISIEEFKYPNLKEEWEKDKREMIEDFLKQREESLNPISISQLPDLDEILKGPSDCMCLGRQRYNFCYCDFRYNVYKYRYHLFQDLYIMNEQGIL